MSVNCFLSLTSSHHYYRCNAFTPALPLSFRYVLLVPCFLPLRFALSDLACLRPLSPLLCSALVCLVVRDGQHMVRLLDRACLAESTGPQASSKMWRMVDSVGVGSGVGVVIDGSSGVNVVMMTYILAYHESNPQLLGLCVKPLTIVITYRICDYNNYISSEYKIFGIL